jgi:hypothetical protein
MPDPETRPPMDRAEALRFVEIEYAAAVQMGCSELLGRNFRRLLAFLRETPVQEPSPEGVFDKALAEFNQALDEWEAAPFPSMERAQARNRANRAREAMTDAYHAQFGVTVSQPKE